MTPTSGEWDDEECGCDNALAELIQGIRHAFICQYAIATPFNAVIDGNIKLSPQRLQLQAQRDKGTLAQHDSSCYELITNARVSWQHAEQICSSRGGHLVYITSSQEQTFVLGFKKDHYRDHAVWIGLTDNSTEEHFQWTSGKAVQFTDWVPGHIANFVNASQENCVVLIPYKDGQWDDIPCGGARLSIFGGMTSFGETHPLLCEYWNMFWLLVTILFSVFVNVWSDYKCVCSYSVEMNVFSTPSEQGDIIGYLYEFDCKPDAGQSDDKWLTVAFEHKLGYIKNNADLQIQTCQGTVPNEDKLEVMTTTIKTSPLTTPTITTTPTTTTTTTKPTTTTSTASSKPTTSTSLPTTLTTTIKVTSKETTTQTFKMTDLDGTTSTKKATTAGKISASPTKHQTTTTLETTTTSSQYITSNTIKGHLELCTSRVHQAAKKDHAILAQFGENCYEVDQTAVSWSHAESICHHNGGHLAHIANQKEQAFIYNFLVKHHGHTAWIGLHDRNYEENFEWSSGNSLNYTNWKPGRKGHHHGHQDCVFMLASTGQWDDVNCGGDTHHTEVVQGHVHAYICQYAIANATAVSSLSHNADGNLNLCSQHLHTQISKDGGSLGQYGQNCYEVVPDIQKTWHQAEYFCHRRGGHLAHIRNAKEQNFLQRFMHRYSPHHAVWIGLTDRYHETHFKWTSGDTAHYFNWVPGHTSNFVDHSIEDCVAFIPYKNGEWDDIPCGHTVSSHHHSHAVGEVHPVLCQYNTVAGPTFVG